MVVNELEDAMSKLRTAAQASYNTAIEVEHRRRRVNDAQNELNEALKAHTATRPDFDSAKAHLERVCAIRGL